VYSPSTANVGCQLSNYPQTGASYLAFCDIAVDSNGISQIISANYTYFETNRFCGGVPNITFVWIGPIPTSNASRCTVANYFDNGVLIQADSPSQINFTIAPPTPASGGANTPHFISIFTVVMVLIMGVLLVMG